MQYASHRADNAELREATLLMSQLLTQWAAPPPAAPQNAALAEMLRALNTTAQAERATRQLALEESRAARQDAAARDDARAANRRLERIADALERNRLRDEETDRRARDEAARAVRVEDELARRALSVAATNTKLHADVQRSFPRAAASDPSEWCAHYADLCLVQARLGISDIMLFQNVATTLCGSLLVSWKAFVQTNNAAVMAASEEHPFSWPVEFERLVVTTADFQRLEVAWRALSQNSATPLTLTALMHAYEAAFVSWGRHAALVPEQTRVSVFLQALSQRNKDYLGVPGSPLRVPDAAVTFRQCCDWLRTFESFGPSDEQLLLGASSRQIFGAAPVGCSSPGPPAPVSSAFWWSRRA